MPMRCADGFIRQCYPILAGFMADYEEQVVLTGVKSGQHCTMCHVPPHERGDLLSTMSGKWPRRTHKSTIEQLKRQQNLQLDRSDPEYIRPIQNFAWSHYIADIHAMMAPDLLHQLYKGVTEHLMSWVRALLLDIEKGKGRVLITNHSGVKTPLSAEDRVERLLTARFAEVKPFNGIIRWDNFAELSQWTGKMYKSLLRQIVPVMAPLLYGHEGAILFIRATVDFALLAEYESHDEDTIEYLKAALYRMDKTKEAFLPYRPDDKNPPNFNIPKLHAISHYPEMIRVFGALMGTTTEHGERAHIPQKNFYRRTNKREGYEEQMIYLNTELTNTMVMQEMELWENTRPIPAADTMEDSYIASLSGMVNLTDEPYRWDYCQSTNQMFSMCGINPNLWRRACEIQTRLGINEFVIKLASFVRECRKRVDGIQATDSDVERLERDAAWAQDLPVGIHHSMICYIRRGKDSRDLNRPYKVRARCNPVWMRTTAPRRDQVLVREYENELNGMKGTRAARLELLVSVQDLQRIDENGRYRVYHGALLELFRPCNGGKGDPFNGMIKVERFPTNTAQNRRNLDGHRIYDISHIERPIQLIPTSLDKRRTFWINSYTDWDIYNRFYDDDFLRINRTRADEFAKKQKSKTELLITSWEASERKRKRPT